VSQLTTKGEKELDCTKLVVCTWLRQPKTCKCKCKYTDRSTTLRLVARSFCVPWRLAAEPVPRCNASRRKTDDRPETNFCSKHKS